MTSKDNKDKKEEEKCCTSDNSKNQLIFVGIIALVVGFAIGYFVYGYLTPSELIVKEVFEPNQTEVAKIKTLMENIAYINIGTKQTLAVKNVTLNEIIRITFDLAGQETVIYVSRDYKNVLGFESSESVDDLIEQVNEVLALNNQSLELEEDNEEIEFDCTNGVDGNVTDLSGKKTTIYFFWGNGCGYCAKEKEFLRELESKNPELLIKTCEVWENQENYQYMVQMANAYGKTVSGVPMTFISDETYVGYAYDSIGKQIEEKIAYCLSSETNCVDPSTKIN